MENTGDQKMKKVLPVPFVSQNSFDVPAEFHNNACGIACTKMILDYMPESYKSEYLMGGLRTMNDLIEEGIVIGGLTDNGWKHDSLVRLLRNRNIMSYCQEYRSIDIVIDQIHGVTFSEGKNYPDIQNIGIEKIIKKINSGLPTIVSVMPNFNDNKETHLILIIGYEIEKIPQNSDQPINGSFYYHDPDSRNGTEKKNKKITINDFIKKWRNLAIFVD